VPPVAKAGGTAFRKDVAFAETKDSDEFELEAAGIVMVPDKADLQNDFAREDTIQAFAEQFAAFEEAGQAGGGIMHAVWPDGWMELTRNEVLDEAEEIGGRTVEAGAWVQRWGIINAELAALVEDGILEGYSIGAIQVDWNGPFEQDEVDIDTSEIPDGELVWQLTDGIIREVSAVDIPAVPDAQILEAKADAQKRLADHVGNQDAFIEEAIDRGHTEAEAERLWDVLNEAVVADGSAEPGKQSALAKAGQAFIAALTPGSDDDGGSGAPDRTAKDGRTLSAANQESAMAAIDANLDMLEDAGIDHGMTRFTDRDDVDFDLSEHDAREWGGDHDDEDLPFNVDSAADASATKHAADGETSAGDGSTDAAAEDMTDEDTNEGEDKSLAEKNAEQIDELTDAVKSLTDAVEGGAAGTEGGEEKTAEIVIDGETYEVSKSEAMSWFDEDGDSGQAGGTEAAATKADIEALHARLDAITREGAGSQQLDQGDAGGKESGLDSLGEALS